MSGRPRSIDRDRLLDAAEAIVAEHGASALSFGSLAKAAGITRGGVQYAFGSREALIRAMVDRWAEGFETRVMQGLGPDPAPQEVIRGHIRENTADGAADFARSGVMITAIIQNPELIDETRAWYNARLAGLDLATPADLATAMALLASEGMFFLQSFGLIGLSAPDRQKIFDGIQRLSGGMPEAP